MWAKGENFPLNGVGFRVTIEAGECLDLSVLSLTSSGTTRSEADFVFYNQPAGRGVSLCQDTTGQPAIDLDLGAVESEIQRLVIAASLDSPSLTFGDVSGPTNPGSPGSSTGPTVQLDQLDGTRVGTFPLRGLSSERAIVVLEFYRRAGAWKARAVGQGYDGGLAELATLCGLDVVDVVDTSGGVNALSEAAQSSQSVQSSRSDQRALPARPIHFTPDHHQRNRQSEYDAHGRLYEQLWGIFEDAARSAAAFDSATSFAHQRLDRELSEAISDPATRHSPRAAAGRATAQRRHDDLVARATADYRRDSDQLTAELAEIAGLLPPPMAAWESPSWRAWTPPSTLVPGVRVGTLQRAGQDGPILPFVVRLPLARPIWIDSAGGRDVAARGLARVTIARILAAYPRGALIIDEIELSHSPGRGGIFPQWGTGLVTRIGSPAELGELLAELVSRVDLARMAQRGNAGAGFPAASEASRVLVWHDFPYGLDERGLTSVRFLVEEGRSAGIYLVFVADPSDVAVGGPTADAIWRSALRLVAEPLECVGDPWVGLEWTYTPEMPIAPEINVMVDRLFDRLG